MSADLGERLAALARLGVDESHAPVFFDPGAPDFDARLEALIRDTPGLRVHDTLREQLAGLLETREPGRKLTREELEEGVRAHLGGDDGTRHGMWVYFPWQARLVHLLAEAEFRELRTSRNRNKITAEEQDRLRALRLGIVGLSVGQATAVTLALEEVGGLYRLADFDRLELSNMNRLRTGVHELGVLKTHLTAREIYEINPYAKVEVFPEGLREENLDEFFHGLDLVYDECDDLAMKVRLREKARALRKPVLMESSDRGLIDVERFDREPTRPLFHGLAGDLSAADLRGLTTYEKVPTVMKIIGQRTMSERLAASLLDIDTTLKTWPQLASAVALGGAINTDVTRRLALGTFGQSGRFFVDLEEIVCDERAAPLERPPGYDVEVSDEARRVDLPFLKRVAPGQLPDRDQLRALVAHAVMAPSGGNCQPWRFVASDGALVVTHERERSQNFLDVDHIGSYVAFGALAENLLLAAGEMGLAATLTWFPAGVGKDEILRATFVGQGGVARDPLVDLVGARCTNRKLGPRQPLAPEILRELEGPCAAHGARVLWLETPESLDELGAILGRGDRMRFLSRTMHRELMSEVRWNKAEVERTRDGIDVATLELTPTDLAGMRLVSSYPVMAMAARLGGGAGLEKTSRKSIAAASAVGLMLVEGNAPPDFVRGGRALQRLWLAATRHHLAFQPMTAITFLFTRLERGGEGLSPRERQELAELYARYRKLFSLPEKLGRTSQVMLFRLAHAGPPTARALRRRLDEVLTFR